MNCTVFYESWQMECCGTAFSIGDTVTWFVYKTTQINTPVDVGEINYYYEAHSSDFKNIFVLEGKVEAIKILYERYAPSTENPRFLVPIGGKVVKTELAEGFEKCDNMQASGYIVHLNEYTIRPAKKEDITFK